MSLLSEFFKSNSFFNVSGEHVSMFVIEHGEQIEKGDFVVINTRTLLARKPIASSGYFAVGVAAKIVQLADGNYAAICTDGYHFLYDPQNNITSNDIGKACYFQDKDTVTMDNINKTKAGTIVDIAMSDDPNDIVDGTNRIIWVKTDLTEGSELEW